MLAALTAAGPTASPWAATPPPPTAERSEQLAPGVLVLIRPGRRPMVRFDPFATPRWHTLARCRETGLQRFFGDDDPTDRPTLRPAVLAAARALCRTCPVRRICLTHALSLPEHYGVWGGTSGRQRDRMLERIDAGETVTTVVDEWLAR